MLPMVYAKVGSCCESVLTTTRVWGLHSLLDMCQQYAKCKDILSNIRKTKNMLIVPTWLGDMNQHCILLLFNFEIFLLCMETDWFGAYNTEFGYVPKYGTYGCFLYKFDIFSTIVCRSLKRTGLYLVEWIDTMGDWYIKYGFWHWANRM